MNPFQKLPPLPSGSIGERHFAAAAAAKESAVNRGVSSYAVLRARDEYAWVAPIGAFVARAAAALQAGIIVVELGRR